MTNSEKKLVEEMHTPIRLNTAIGEVIASKRLTLLLCWPTSADALVMRGCPNMSPEGRAFQLVTEKYAPVFHATASSSSSPMDSFCWRARAGSDPRL